MTVVVVGKGVGTGVNRKSCLFTWNWHLNSFHPGKWAAKLPACLSEAFLCLHCKHTHSPRGWVSDIIIHQDPSFYFCVSSHVILPLLLFQVLTFTFLNLYFSLSGISPFSLDLPSLSIMLSIRPRSGHTNPKWKNLSWSSAAHLLLIF